MSGDYNDSLGVESPANHFDILLTGRRKMILSGLSAVVVIEIYAAIMQMEFQNTNNQVGKGFAVL